MEYKFYCPKCDKESLVEIPLKDYDDAKYNQTCKVCNGPIRRVIEWNGPASINGGYEAVAGKAKWQ